MHFTAFSYVRESVTHPRKYYRNNASGSLNLLEAARERGIQSFVFSCTCASYGMPDALPITESRHQRPINPYGSSKLMVERTISDIEATHGMRCVVLRYFNAAGADPEGKFGEYHDHKTHLISLALDVAFGRRSYVTIYGDD